MIDSYPVFALGGPTTPLKAPHDRRTEATYVIASYTGISSKEAVRLVWLNANAVQRRFSRL